jgi:hypothetical protein
MPEHGVPGSFGYDDNGNLMTYANTRPSLSQRIVELVWNRMSGGKGYIDVRGVDGPRRIYWKPGEPRTGLWDMGHETGSEYWRMRNRYLNHGYAPGNPAENERLFLEEYRDPEKYDVQDWLRNRSHIDEAR